MLRRQLTGMNCRMDRRSLLKWGVLGAGGLSLATLLRHRSADHLVSVLVLGFVALFVAMVVTPADPLSMLLAFIPIFIFGLFAYWYGLRAGRSRRTTAGP